MLACTCFLPWCYSKTHSPDTEKVFAKLRTLYDCTKLALLEADINNTESRCNRTFDGWSCWPPTPAGAEARVPCPHLLPGKVNFSAVAKYACHLNGSWDAVAADYSSCTSSSTENSELTLLHHIAQELGDDVPWERKQHSGEDGIVEEKIDRFKDCLEDVLLKPSPLIGLNDSVCPRTWDGWSCWNDTLPGHTAFAPCPQFVAGFVPYSAQGVQFQRNLVCPSRHWPRLVQLHGLRRHPRLRVWQLGKLAVRRWILDIIGGSRLVSCHILLLQISSLQANNNS